MIWRHRGVDIPLEIYHGVPAGWSADEIFAEHKALSGTFPIDDFKIGKWAAPSWMTQRFEWLRYRQTLLRVADGVRAHDAACVEIAIRYICLRHIGSKSGFIRGKLARSLKTAVLTDEQKKRLNRHFLEIVRQRDYTQEFHEYSKLWEQIIDTHCLNAVVAHFGQHHPDGSGDGVSRPWVAGLIRAFDQRS